MIDDAAGYRVECTGGAAKLTFARPELGNAISSEMVPGLVSFFVEAQRSADVRCILLSGEGRHFSTGGDLASFSRLLDETPDTVAATFDEKLAATAELVEAILAFDRPIVAAVRGGVAGAGLMFALAADIVLVDDTAMFLFSHQRMGLSPDGGVSWLLPRIVGMREASYLILTAGRVDGAGAVAKGLATQMLSADLLDEEVAKLTRRLTQAPQTAIRAAKRLLASSERLSAHEQLIAERQEIVSCVREPDFAEGIRAFMEKRAASFPSASERRQPIQA